MYGLTPQQATCPHCGIARTVRIGFSGISLCMNCHTRWGPNSSTIHPPTDPELDAQQAYPFDAAELARLEVCRRAVAAGFYTDYFPAPRRHSLDSDG
jgi:hypothetical protein